MFLQEQGLSCRGGNYILKEKKASYDCNFQIVPQGNLSSFSLGTWFFLEKKKFKLLPKQLKILPKDMIVPCEKKGA
jgi:hypothetical protein